MWHDDDRLVVRAEIRMLYCLSILISIHSPIVRIVRRLQEIIERRAALDGRSGEDLSGSLLDCKQLRGLLGSRSRLASFVKVATGCHDDGRPTSCLPDNTVQFGQSWRPPS